MSHVTFKNPKAEVVGEVSVCESQNDVAEQTPVRHPDDIKAVWLYPKPKIPRPASFSYAHGPSPAVMSGIYPQGRYIRTEHQKRRHCASDK